MSELHLTDSETKGFPARGPDTHLSPAEESFVQRILAHPESFPKSFWSAVMQKVALDGEPVPFTQISGFRRYTDSVTEVQDGLSVIGTTYADVGSTVTTTSNGDVDITEPTVTVPAGTYFCIVTCTAAWASGGVNAILRLNNGDTNNAFGSQQTSTALSSSGANAPLTSIGSVEVTEETNLHAYCSQSGNGSINFTQLFLIALRTG